MTVPQSSRQPARTETELRSRYITVLARAIRCVHPTVQPRIGPSPRAGAFRSLAWSEEPIPVPTPRGDQLYLAIDQLLEIVPNPDYPGEIKYSTRMYSYAVYESEQPDAPTLFHWHWNPASDWPDPHLHLSIEDPRQRGPRLHIPTGGRVTIETVLRFLIREQMVTPANDDWEQQLSDGQRLFDDYHST